jgi:hypothetical protein
MPLPPIPPNPAPGTQVSGFDLVKSAMRALGAIASGENPSAAELNDGLAAANQMFDSWNAQRLMVFTVDSVAFPLTNNKQTYTLGPGGDFDSPRPPQIDWASIIYTGSSPQPLEIPIEVITDPKEWRDIVLKGTTSSFPTAVYDDGGFPFRNLMVWPVPGQNVQINLYVWSALSQFPDGKTVLTFPPGYAEAIRFNLAIRLAPDFQAEPSQTLVELAISSLAVVKSINIPILEMACDDALLSGRGGSGSGYIDFVSGR